MFAKALEDFVFGQSILPSLCLGCKAGMNSVETMTHDRSCWAFTMLESLVFKIPRGHRAVFASWIQFSIFCCNRQVPEEVYQKPKAIASKQDLFLAVVK